LEREPLTVNRLLTLASPQSDFEHIKSKAGIYAIVYLPGALGGAEVDAYIGSAWDLNNRLIRHVEVGGDSPRLNNAVAKYGAHNFALIILEYVDVRQMPRKQATPILVRREQEWFERAAFDTLYNIAPVAGSVLGLKIPAIGEANRRRPITPEYRQTLSNALRGCTHKPEHRAKIGDAMRGKPKPAEHRANMRKPKSAEGRLNMRVARHIQWHVEKNKPCTCAPEVIAAYQQSHKLRTR
jgi:group I intron endonuclease